MTATIAGVDERVVVRAWMEQSITQPALRTRSGQHAHVVYRGRWNGGAGPDFQDGLVSLANGQLLKGDIEVHVHASDWAAHRHDLDPRYNAVALHVVMWDDTDSPILKENGQGVETIALADCLSVSLESLIPATSGIPTSDMSDEPCWTYLSQTPDQALAGILDEAGDERFKAKAAACEAGLDNDNAEQVIYGSLMEALGYSQNRVPFVALARTLRIEYLYGLLHRRSAVEVVLVAESLLLGVAGLQTCQRQIERPFDWETTTYAGELETVWRAAGSPWESELMREGAWETRGVRPANHPVRRIAAAARLVARHLESGLVETALRALERSGSVGPLALMEPFELSDPDSYWGRHYDFGLAIPGASPALVGRQRAQEMVTNVVLPFLAAYGEQSNDREIVERSRAAYQKLPPAGSNIVVKRMTAQLLGPRSRRLPMSARRQQGLIHLYRLYCRDRQCLSCPVALFFARSQAT